MRALLAVVLWCAPIVAFDIPFYPGNSTVYQPERSATFRVAPNEMFYLGYADKSQLKGFQAFDVVQLGKYYTLTKFGAVTYCNSPDFNGVDGILGAVLQFPIYLPQGSVFRHRSSRETECLILFSLIPYCFH